MVIFPLAPNQTIAQMWSNGARGAVFDGGRPSGWPVMTELTGSGCGRYETTGRRGQERVEETERQGSYDRCGTTGSCLLACRSASRSTMTLC